MSVKDKIAELLEKNRDRYLSGNDMAEILGISRTAVWKAVKKLESEGYVIEAVNNKGYRLSSGTDVLSEAGIRKYLKDEESMWDIYVYDEVSSTNSIVRELADSGAAEGTVAAAVSQTAGRGRLGRSFFSPKDTGVYFSLLLRPELPLDKVTLITTAAAVAQCRAVEKISDCSPGIKWVNDILLNGRKICGIGTEAVFNAEMGSLDYLILGVGTNLYLPEGGFPEDIQEKAGYVFEKREDDIRNRLIGEFLKQFESIYRNLNSGSFVDEYRSRCCILDKDVFVCRGENRTSAHTLDIDDACRLRVRYEDGREEYLNSGEISLKFENYI